VAVQGSYAYIAAGSSGLQILDISDPASPIYLGSVDTPGIASGVALLGDRVFIAAGTSGLQIIDISDPANPHVAKGVDTPGEAFGRAVADMTLENQTGKDVVVRRPSPWRSRPWPGRSLPGQRSGCGV